MLALCLMLLGTYYAQNYASIIGGCLFIAARFGLTKRKRLKPDAVPTIFHRPINIAASTSYDHLQEGSSVNPSVGHKRASVTEESLAGPQKKKKAAFEKRERARVAISLIYS